MASEDELARTSFRIGGSPNSRRSMIVNCNSLIASQKVFSFRPILSSTQTGSSGEVPTSLLVLFRDHVRILLRVSAVCLSGRVGGCRRQDRPTPKKVDFNRVVLVSSTLGHLSLCPTRLKGCH